MSALTGNKGEWSEIYVLFKILGDGKLYAGDADLNKIEDLFYPIIKVIRNESGGEYEYKIKKGIILVSPNGQSIRISMSEFNTRALKLLESIKKGKGAFSNPETEKFMAYIGCNSLKAKSSDKADIRIELHDSRVNQNHILGFSIKSKLGGGSSLFNAGTTTNFIYKIKGIRNISSISGEINSINTKFKIKDRLSKIKDNQGDLEYFSVFDKTFHNNLVLIDSLLPKIIGALIKSYYMSSLSTVKELVNDITNTNPLKYDMGLSHPFYTYKIKKFLTDVALGMTPAKVWSGTYDATGGYLVIKEDGEVLCYHIYNRNEFEDYLFNNTKLDTASSTRHDFGLIYCEKGEYFIKLNLQIRFM